MPLASMSRFGFFSDDWKSRRTFRDWFLSDSCPTSPSRATALWMRACCFVERALAPRLPVVREEPEAAHRGERHRQGLRGERPLLESRRARDAPEPDRPPRAERVRKVDASQDPSRDGRARHGGGLPRGEPPAGHVRAGPRQPRSGDDGRKDDLPRGRPRRLPRRARPHPELPRPVPVQGGAEGYEGGPPLGRRAEPAAPRAAHAEEDEPARPRRAHERPRPPRSEEHT